MELLAGIFGAAGSASTLYGFISDKFKNDDKVFKSTLRRNIIAICDASSKALSESPELKDIIPSYAADVIFDEVVNALENKTPLNVDVIKGKLNVPRDDIFTQFMKLIDGKLQKCFEYSQRDYNNWSRQKLEDIISELGDIKKLLTDIKTRLYSNDRPRLNVMPSICIELSDDEKKMIKAASLDSNGTIRTIDLLGGTEILTNNTSFDKQGIPREVARWKSALASLQIKGYIAKNPPTIRTYISSSSMEIYSLTDKGYKEADTLPADIQIHPSSAVTADECRPAHHHNIPAPSI